MDQMPRFWRIWAYTRRHGRSDSGLHAHPPRTTYTSSSHIEDEDGKISDAGRDTYCPWQRNMQAKACAPLYALHSLQRDGDRRRSIHVQSTANKMTIHSYDKSTMIPSPNWSPNISSTLECRRSSRALYYRRKVVLSAWQTCCQATGA